MTFNGFLVQIDTLSSLFEQNVDVQLLHKKVRERVQKDNLFLKIRLIIFVVSVPKNRGIQIFIKISKLEIRFFIKISRKDAFGFYKSPTFFSMELWNFLFESTQDSMKNISWGVLYGSPKFTKNAPL